MWSDQIISPLYHPSVDLILTGWRNFYNCLQLHESHIFFSLTFHEQYDYNATNGTGDHHTCVSRKIGQGFWLRLCCKIFVFFLWWTLGDLLSFVFRLWCYILFCWCLHIFISNLLTCTMILKGEKWNSLKKFLPLNKGTIGRKVLILNLTW